jgi:transcriptional regulator with XRE-family HTH domain
MVQATRVRVGLTQGRLADRVGTSQQWISRIERGGVDLRLSDAERLLAAIGKQVLVRAVPLADVAAADPDLVAEDDMGRVAEAFAMEFAYVWRRFAAVPYLVGGRLAALVQGLPVRPFWLELVIAEADLAAANAAMNWLNVVRWSDVNQDFTNYDCDLTSPAPRRFMMTSGRELWVRATATRASAAVAVVIDEQTLAVVPLGALLREDHDVAQLADRLGATSPAPGSGTVGRS